MTHPTLRELALDIIVMLGILAFISVLALVVAFLVGSLQ